jgi:hypothetical protein
MLRLRLHGTAEKGRKDYLIEDNMPVKGGGIEVGAVDPVSGAPTIQTKGHTMARTGQKTIPREKEGGKPATPIPSPAPIEDDDREDGDIATPKRDRHGTDDEPL